MKFFSTLGLVTVLLATQTANAGTKTLTFGWEDGTSTTLGSFVSSEAGIAVANVSSGSELDYGPSDAPFAIPVEYNPAPFDSRMLEIKETPLGTGSGGPRAFVAFVENLDDGDEVKFSFKGYDPSDGRSPSILPVGIYTQAGDIDGFAGFLTPFQEFPPGTGWLDIHADFDPDGVNFPNDGAMIFDTDGASRDSAVLEVRVFRPSLAVDAGRSDYNFYIDDMSVTVTSDNPDASITMPDGSVTLVNPIVACTPDLNGDTFVDGVDLGILLGNWGLAVDCEDGNLNEEGNVDGVDLGILLGAWDPAPLGTASVPEPTSLALLALAGVSLLANRRKRS